MQTRSQAASRKRKREPKRTKRDPRPSRQAPDQEEKENEPEEKHVETIRITEAPLPCSPSRGHGQANPNLALDDYEERCWVPPRPNLKEPYDKKHLHTPPSQLAIPPGTLVHLTHDCRPVLGVVVHVEEGLSTDPSYNVQLLDGKRVTYILSGRDMTAYGFPNARQCDVIEIGPVSLDLDLASMLDKPKELDSLLASSSWWSTFTTRWASRVAQSFISQLRAGGLVPVPKGKPVRLGKSAISCSFSLFCHSTMSNLFPIRASFEEAYKSLEQYWEPGRAPRCFTRLRESCKRASDLDHFIRSYWSEQPEHVWPISALGSGRPTDMVPMELSLAYHAFWPEMSRLSEQLFRENGQPIEPLHKATRKGVVVEYTTRIALLEPVLMALAETTASRHTNFIVTHSEFREAWALAVHHIVSRCPGFLGGRDLVLPDEKSFCERPLSILSSSSSCPPFAYVLTQRMWECMMKAPSAVVPDHEPRLVLDLLHCSTATSAMLAKQPVWRRVWCMQPFYRLDSSLANSLHLTAACHGALLDVPTVATSVLPDPSTSTDPWHAETTLALLPFHRFMTQRLGYFTQSRAEIKVKSEDMVIHAASSGVESWLTQVVRLVKEDAEHQAVGPAVACHQPFAHHFGLDMGNKEDAAKAREEFNKRLRAERRAIHGTIEVLRLAVAKCVASPAAAVSTLTRLTGELQTFLMPAPKPLSEDKAVEILHSFCKGIQTMYLEARNRRFGPLDRHTGKRLLAKDTVLPSDPSKCPICLGSLSAPRQNSCGHAFCHACIEQWRLHIQSECITEDSDRPKDPTCPMCRKPLEDILTVPWTEAYAQDDRLAIDLADRALDIKNELQQRDHGIRQRLEAVLDLPYELTVVILPTVSDPWFLTLHDLLKSRGMSMSPPPFSQCVLESPGSRGRHMLWVGANVVSGLSSVYRDMDFRNAVFVVLDPSLSHPKRRKETEKTLGLMMAHAYTLPLPESQLLHVLWPIVQSSLF